MPPVADAGPSANAVVAARWPAPETQPGAQAVRTVPVEAAPQSTGATATTTIAARQSVPEPAPSAPPVITAGKTELLHFASAPFPYKGEGARLPSGRILRIGRSYSDDRVLIHIPEGFNPNQPAVMVVFFHGHGAELSRDVLERQQVPAQISMAGVNAVLVAPQFAVNAADSNPGRFGEPGGFARFVSEASRKLSQLTGNPKRGRAFDTMPVVVVAYSGGYLPAAAVIGNGGIGKRLRGVVLLDALYGELGAFSGWIKTHPKFFFISAYTSSTRRHHEEFARILEAQGTKYATTMPENLWRGRVALIATEDEVNHRDFVTRAWAEFPIKDVLAKLN